MNHLHNALKAAYIFLTGLAILMCASCSPASAPTIALTPSFSSNEEPTSTFTPTPNSSPNEDPTSTSPPDAYPSPISSVTRTSPTTAPTNTPTGGLEWSSHLGVPLTFRYPGHCIRSYVYDRKDEFFEYAKDPNKDIGMFFHEVFNDDPARLLAQWAEDGMDIPGLLSFSPETVVDGDNIVISRNEATILRVQGNGFTVQATYLQPENIDKVVGIIGYAPSDQWEAMEEIFSEILSSIEFMVPFSGRFLPYTVMPYDWSGPASHPDGEGMWSQSADKKIGMLVGINTPNVPAKILEEHLGFSNCSVPIPGDQMEILDGVMVDTFQGKCLDNYGLEVTHKVAYKEEVDPGGRIRLIEIVMYFPNASSEYANWIFSITYNELCYWYD